MSKKISSIVNFKQPKILYKDLSKVRVNGQEVEGLAYKYDNLIEIDKNLSDKHMFYTCVHELVGHMILPDLTEKQVLKLEKIVGDSLWVLVLKFKR
jgi:hypothetical protein